MFTSILEIVTGLQSYDPLFILEQIKEAMKITCNTDGLNYGAIKLSE